MKLTSEDISKIEEIAEGAKVIEKLGGSVLGNVYKIDHPKYGVCVLKVFQGKAVENKNFLKRFLELVARAKDIHHPNVAKIYEVKEGEEVFIIREYAEGVSLKDKLQEEGRLSLKKAMEVLLQAISALEPLHQLDIVHKNLKPGNIIITSSEPAQVKVVDFALPPTTPHYLSPEQCKGKKSDVRSDIYALGALFYYSLAGKPAHEGSTPKEIMEAHLHKHTPNIYEIRQDIPKSILEILQRMLAKSPENRPSDCYYLGQLFKEIIDRTKEETQIVDLSESGKSQTPSIDQVLSSVHDSGNSEPASSAELSFADEDEIDDEAFAPEHQRVDSSDTNQSSSSQSEEEKETSSIVSEFNREDSEIQLTSIEITADEKAEALAAAEDTEEIPPTPLANPAITPPVTDKDELYTDSSTVSLVPTEEPTHVKNKRIAKFKQVATDMASKLKIVNQTLSMIDNVEELESILFLDEMLRFITMKTGEFLRSDRTIIFIYDEEKNELLPIVDRDDGTYSMDSRIPVEGIAGEVINNKQVVNIPYDCYDDPRSESRKSLDVKAGYRTYTMLALPLLNTQGNPVGVVQLINKLKKVNDLTDELSERIDKKGFTSEDENLFGEFAPSIRLILESSRSFYRATQRQRAAASLMSAIQTLSQSSLDLEETLHRVMDEAKQLLDADRITLWLLDREKDELWANIEMSDGSMKEIRIPRNVGFAGQIVETGKPVLIPFDLYNHPDSETAKKTDQMTGYRTCSMLCMPVSNANGDLIGVTQLINKKRQGNYPPYNPADWPNAPDCWKASFDSSDLEFMESFNIQAGVAIQNAKLFATVKQQEQMQRNILRSLTNGVISTDKAGHIIAANESAKSLLGLKMDDKMEGRDIRELVKIKSSNFSSWVEAALKGEHQDEKSDQQYYPEQTLMSQNGDEHSVNISINTINDVSDPSLINGALVVLDDISDEKRIKGMMYRYMTQEVVEQLLASGDIKLGGQRKEVTVLFSDIRSYTTLTEGVEAEEVVAMLNEYFEEMVDALFRYKGTLDKYIGDALMAVFGSPLPLEDHGWCAVQTAIDMRHRLVEFNRGRQRRGKKEISIGIGIHSDQVVSGNIGSSKRMELTSIGDGVNLASRLEGASKQYGCDIVISENTYRTCYDRVYVRELDNIIVKGKTKPVKIYDLVGLRTEDIPAQRLQVMELYQQGRDLYISRNFQDALKEFQQVLELDPNNVAAKMHIKRCQHFIDNPPPEDWDGVWKLTSK